VSLLRRFSILVLVIIINYSFDFRLFFCFLDSKCCYVHFLCFINSYNILKPRVFLKLNKNCASFFLSLCYLNLVTIFYVISSFLFLHVTLKYIYIFFLSHNLHDTSHLFSACHFYINLLLHVLLFIYWDHWISLAVHSSFLLYPSFSLTAPLGLMYPCYVLWSTMLCPNIWINGTLLHR